MRISDYVTSDYESVPEIVPFHQRRKGPSHPGLASLRPSNQRYDRLMSYRYYRLNKTSHTRNHAITHQLHKLLKNVNLSFKESKFTGKDPILIFDFLARMVEECDTLNMSEAQAFMTLPHFLSDTARCKADQDPVEFRASRRQSSTSSARMRRLLRFSTQLTNCDKYVRTMTKTSSRSPQGSTTRLTAAETSTRKTKR